MSQFVGEAYQNRGQISEYTNIKSNRNTKKAHAIDEPFIRTDKKILSRTKKFLRKNGMSLENVYDCINKGSVGVFESHFQIKELRHAQQVYRQKSNESSAAKEDSKDELLTLIGLQNQSPTFIRAVSCLSKSFYVFLSDDSQVQDVRADLLPTKQCLIFKYQFQKKKVKCKNWVIDSCHLKQCVENVDAKHPVFLGGPSIIHFEK